MIAHLEHIFLNVFNIILPVLICVGVGYTLALIKAPFDTKVVNDLISRVGFPTLVISHISTAQIDGGTFITVVGAAAVAVAGFAVLSLIALRLLGYSIAAFLGPLMHGNVGSIGLPVTLLAFGDAGMAYAMGFVVVILLSMFTVGIWIPSGTISVKAVLTSPVIYAALIALGLVLTGTHLPKPIESSFDILGGLAIPMLLLTMGHTLASFQVRDVKQAGLLTVLHLCIAGSVAVACSVGVWIYRHRTWRGDPVLSYAFLGRELPVRGSVPARQSTGCSGLHSGVDSGDVNRSALGADLLGLSISPPVSRVLDQPSDLLRR